MSRFLRVKSKPRQAETYRPGGPYPGPTGFCPARDGTRWEIMVAGELGDKALELHQAFLDVPPNSRGVIYFDSCGGSVWTGLALSALIRFRGLEAAGVVAGECSSAALMPFAACTERYVTSHASLLFHPIRSQSEEHVRLEEAEEWARHFRHMERDQDELLARLFGCELSLIEKWSRPGRFLSGEDLVEAGLAKKIDLFSGDVWKQMREAKAP